MSKQAFAVAERIENQVPLGPRTTLELGGPARHLVTVSSVDEVLEALRWAREKSLPVAILGGGSNLVVADGGFDGLVLVIALRGLKWRQCGDEILVRAAAGEIWDDLVAETTRRGLAGVECLSGIPGSVGATPIQNVGAYGQEIADVIDGVQIVDLQSLEVRTLDSSACGFGYRTSIFRQSPATVVVASVTYRLRPNGRATVVYDELRRALGSAADRASLEGVREAVLELRRSKSMGLDPADPNRRSVGSFFINPIIDDSQDLERVRSRARACGVLGPTEELPHHRLAGGAVKLSAAWLIERSGFARGTRKGPVGISSRHTLALVHHGGGSTADLLALAREIRDAVSARFGVTLEPEPTFLGFGDRDPLT
jgi:UDP-N-acetylmuramate dehydrogenase